MPDSVGSFEKQPDGACSSCWWACVLPSERFRSSRSSGSGQISSWEWLGVKTSQLVGWFPALLPRRCSLQTMPACRSPCPFAPSYFSTLGSSGAADGGSGCPLHSQPEGSPRLPHVRGGVSSFCGRGEWATKTKRILEPSSGDRVSRGTPLSSAVHLCHLGSLGPLGTSIGSSFSSCLNVQ